LANIAKLLVEHWSKSFIFGEYWSKSFFGANIGLNRHNFSATIGQNRPKQLCPQVWRHRRHPVAPENLEGRGDLRPLQLQHRAALLVQGVAQEDPGAGTMRRRRVKNGPMIGFAQMIGIGQYYDRYKFQRFFIFFGEIKMGF
jgi:hypothetical protein